MESLVPEGAGSSITSPIVQMESLVPEVTGISMESPIVQMESLVPEVAGISIESSVIQLVSLVPEKTGNNIESSATQIMQPPVLEGINNHEPPTIQLQSLATEEVADRNEQASVLTNTKVRVQQTHSSSTENVSPSSAIKSVDQNILSILECPVCYQFMTPPITLCVNGHNICYECRSRLAQCPTCRKGFLKTRNIALEELARYLQLPCRYSNVGCQENCSMDNHQEHCITHSLQPTYLCPMALYSQCDWHGKHSDIKPHVEENHSDNIRHGIRNGGNWTLKLAVKDTRVMFAMGEIFLYRQRLDTIKRKFFITVQFIGPKNNSLHYKYEIELSTQTGNQKIVIGNVVLPHDEDIDNVYRTGKCIVIDYQAVSYLTIDNNMKYSLTISRAAII